MKKSKKLQQQLQSRKLDNGFFLASLSSKNPIMTSHIWIRDCANIYPGLDKEHKIELADGFYNLYKYNQELGKFNFKDFNVKSEWAHIHPIYTKELREINKKWAFIQNDAIGQFYQMLCKSPKFTQKDSYIFLKYLAHINYPYCKDYGAWEQGPLEIRASSIAQCIRGIQENEKRFKPTKKTRKLKQAGYNQLIKILEYGETKTRKADLALTSILYPDDLDPKIITKDIKNSIITKLKSLERDLGLIRYQGDKWNGNDWEQKSGKEMPWPIGLALMYLITKEKDYIIRLREIYNKFGYIPEGIINNESNGTDLTEALAFYILAEK